MIFFHQGFYRPNFDKRSGVMMPGSRKLSKVGGGGGGGFHLQTRVGPDSRDFFSLRGGVELRGSGPPVPNPGLCMVIILKIFKMKEKMRWRDT